jgi:hypothetical protein
MQPIVKDTKKDAARPAHPDTTSTSTGEHSRLNKIANDMAGRGMERQRKDEEGKDVIVQSDPHGSN